jgi:hypothetical protein
MTLSSLSFTQRTSASEGIEVDEIRAIGDLIRYIEDARVGSMMGRRRALPHDVTNAADPFCRACLAVRL